MSARMDRDVLRPRGHQVVVVVRDRLDALERLLGTIRRRRMDLAVLSVARTGEELVVFLRSEGDVLPHDRWIAELQDLVDVLQVRVTSPARPDAPPPELVHTHIVQPEGDRP